MRRVLNRDEIDALFSAALPGENGEAAGPQKHVESCDLGKSKTLSTEMIRVVNTLHESFARRLSVSLGTYLRTGCEMNLVAAEQLRYSEFLGRVPGLSYLASLRMLPIDAGALILMDLSLVFRLSILRLAGLAPTSPNLETPRRSRIRSSKQLSA
jgi:flagellar motor switch protein FliM